MLIILQARYLPESLDVWKSKPDEFYPQKNDTHWYTEEQVKSDEDALFSIDPSGKVQPYAYENPPLSNDGNFDSGIDGDTNSLADSNFNFNVKLSVDETVEPPVETVELENVPSAEIIELGNVPSCSTADEEFSKYTKGGDNRQRGDVVPDPHHELHDGSLDPLLADMENDKSFKIINHIQILRVAQKSTTTTTNNNNNDNDSPLRRPLSQEFCYRIFADATSEVQDVDVSMTFFVKSTFKIHVVRTEEIEIVEVLQKKSAPVGKA